MATSITQDDLNKWLTALIKQSVYKCEQPTDLEDDLTNQVNQKLKEISDFKSKEHPDRDVYVTQANTLDSELKSILSQQDEIKYRNKLKTDAKNSEYESKITAAKNDQKSVENIFETATLSGKSVLKMVQDIQDWILNTEIGG